MRPQFPPGCTRCGQHPAPKYDVSDDGEERHFCKACARDEALSYRVSPSWWDLARISGRAAARIEATQQLRTQHTHRLDLFYPKGDITHD